MIPVRVLHLSNGDELAVASETYQLVEDEEWGPLVTGTDNHTGRKVIVPTHHVVWMELGLAEADRYAPSPDPDRSLFPS